MKCNPGGDYVFMTLSNFQKRLRDRIAVLLEVQEYFVRLAGIGGHFGVINYHMALGFRRSVGVLLIRSIPAD
jgi:hypothetical protein